MEATALFKCLADQTRLTSVLLLRREPELCVCEFTAALESSQPKISRHLAQLKNCGLIVDRRQGQWIFYRLARNLPPWLYDTLDRLIASDPELVSPALNRLASMGDRPQRQTTCC